MLFGYLLFHFRSVLAVLVNLLPGRRPDLDLWPGRHYLRLGQPPHRISGAILGGLGIEHGIHLLGRYEVLRGKGDSSEAATRESFTHTGGAALISALVAALTFLSLAYSEFRAFREFGVIAALGMIGGPGGVLPVLPALLGVATKLGWDRRRAP